MVNPLTIERVVQLCQPTAKWTTFRPSRPANEGNTLFTPKKPSLARSASQAELDPVPFRRFLLNTSTNSQEERALKPLQLGESLGQRKSGDGKRILSDSHLQPSPTIFPNKRRAVSEGAQQDWRTVLANEQQRPPSVSPDARGIHTPGHDRPHRAPNIVLHAPLSHGCSPIAPLVPQTPSPQPRPTSKPPPLPLHLVAIDDIGSNLRALREQFSSTVRVAREAYEAADRAKKTAISALERTQSACESLKAAAESEMQSIDAMQLDRDRNASQVDVLKVRVADNTKEIKQKSAKIDEMNKQVEFLQNTLNAEKVRQASFDSVIADAVNEAQKAKEESRQLSAEVDRLQEANRQSQSRLRKVAARQLTLSRALSDAGKENDNLLTQIGTLRSALEGFAGDKIDDLLASSSRPIDSEPQVPVAQDESRPLQQQQRAEEVPVRDLLTPIQPHGQASSRTSGELFG